MTDIKSLIVNDPDLAKCNRLSTDERDVYVCKDFIDDYETEPTDEDFYSTEYYFTVSGDVCKYVERYWEEFPDGDGGRYEDETIINTVEDFNKFKWDVTW